MLIVKKLKSLLFVVVWLEALISRTQCTCGLAFRMSYTHTHRHLKSSLVYYYKSVLNE